MTEEIVELSTGSLFGRPWPASARKMPLTELRRRDSKAFHVRIIELQKQNAEKLTIRFSKLNQHQNQL